MNLFQLRKLRIILRIMRNSAVSDALFPKARRGILAATYGHPERWWYLSELADWLETTPSSLQREIKSLTNGGLLQKKKEAGRIYYKAETETPFFEPLKNLVFQAMGVIPALEELFAESGAETICAFIYGSVARGSEHAGSDIDIMAIGTGGTFEFASGLRKLEKKFKREFNINYYKPEEFIRKLREDNHFLNTLMKEKKIFIKGKKDDLEELIK